MIKRRNDWAAQLSGYLHKIKDKKFKWGTHDCVMHSVNCVKAITGFDMAKGKRQRYKTREGAYILVAKEFDGDLDNGWTEFFGEKREDIKKARRGDVVRITYENQKTYGVIDDTGRSAVMITPKNGLIRIPIAIVEVYWRVG